MGTLVLLDQQEVVDAGSVIADWRPALILLGVTTEVLSGSALSVLWPVGIIGLGLWLLLRRPGATGRASASRTRPSRSSPCSREQCLANTAREFRGGSATAAVGGVEVDLADATIEGEAVLDTVALFGGVDVFVPNGWRVVLDGPAIFGANENHVPTPTDPEAPTLARPGHRDLRGRRGQGGEDFGHLRSGDRIRRPLLTAGSDDVPPNARLTGGGFDPFALHMATSSVRANSDAAFARDTSAPGT